MSPLYILGLVYLIIFIPIPIGWIIIHLTISFWRKLGRYSYIVFLFYLIIFGLLILFYKNKLLSKQHPFNIALFVLGFVLILTALYLDRKRASVFDLKRLIGFPEIMPDKFKPKLVKEGIYSIIRHPRYIEYMLFSSGIALIIRFYYIYLIQIYMIISLYILILIEEKELKQRFGREYISYCKNVPRLIPKLK